MGAFCNSICIPKGTGNRSIVDALDRWLVARGFDRESGPLLFDLDGDIERCAYVLTNSDWSLVFFSHHDEDLRLIHELAVLEPRALYVWVWDNDAWGYDLFLDRAFLGSFSSNPKVFTSFAGATGAQRRPAGSFDSLRAWTGDLELAKKLAVTRRRQTGYSEDSCRQFCASLGIPAAVSSFDELDRGGDIDGSGKWDIQRLLYRRRDRVASSVDLHQHDLEAGTTLSRQFTIPLNLRQEMADLERRLRVTVLILKPVSMVARLLRKTYRQGMVLITGRAHAGSWNGIDRPKSGSTRIQISGREMTNLRHRCRLHLAVGAEPAIALDRPASVFAFRIEAADAPVTCTARRPAQIEEILQRPSGALTLFDECYSIGPLPARRVLYELPWRANQKGGFLALEVVQTEKVFYVFLCRTVTRLSAEGERTIRKTIAGFEML